MSQEKWQGPIYDLMRAYSKLTFGNRFPRVMAGFAARKWVHEYARKHSSFPHCEDRYGETRIERGDVADDTFKFFLDDEVKEGIMQSYRERIGHMFSSPTPPPNLEPIYVIVPVGGKIYIDHSTEEGRKAWINAHPIERFIEKDTPNIFLIRRTPEYIAEVEQMAEEEIIPQE